MLSESESKPLSYAPSGNNYKSMGQFNPIQERQSVIPEEQQTKPDIDDSLYEGTYNLGKRDGYGVLKNR